MPGAQHHNPEIKTAIAAAILAGKAVADISREFNVPKQTVSRIKKELPERELGQIGTNSRSRLDELLREAVAANLAAQAFILDAVCNVYYLREHDPEKVGSLFGQIGDRAVRILEIAGPFLATAGDEPD